MNTQMDDSKLKHFCHHIPKAELHVHIEGTLEPELMFTLSQRNSISIPYKSVDEVKSKFNFANLQEFLDMYYLACSVLIKQEDFSDLIYEYLKKVSQQGVVYAEIFFDPQTHTGRGISFETVLFGLREGMERGLKDFRIESQLIICILRCLSEEEGIEILNLAYKYKEQILGVGLDSAEIGNPPRKFKKLYEMAKEYGFRLCAHAGEEGGDWVEEALDELKVERIDHGFKIVNNKALMKRIAQERIPLTLCPLSIKVLHFYDLTKFPVKEYLEEGILATINSDDPAYFGGYIGDNYYEIAKALELSRTEIIQLSLNSFNATFLNFIQKEKYLQNIEDFLANN
jgi:adenosine deaminase